MRNHLFFWSITKGRFPFSDRFPRQAALVAAPPARKRTPVTRCTPRRVPPVTSTRLFPSIRRREGFHVPLRSAASRTCARQRSRRVRSRRGMPDDLASTIRRHSLATFLSANDVHLSVTRSILRHKNMRTVADVFHSCGQCQTDCSQQKYLAAIGMQGCGG